MSKSLEFCVQRASNQEASIYSDRDWTAAREIECEGFFDNVLHGERKLTISKDNENGDNMSLKIELQFDPDADFSYFTSKCCIHDGTLLFVYECMAGCACNILRGTTYDKRVGQPQNGDVIKYTVGNFVLLNEYVDSGHKFSPDAKPWMHQRTTCLVPIIMTKGIINDRTTVY